MKPDAKPITNGYPALLRLSVRQLQALAVLGEQRNIHRAAAAMNVSQPAMSKLVSDLERRIDARLFVRGPRGAEPTPAGSALIQHARSILGEVKRAADDLEAAALGHPETLRIGTLQSSATALVPGAVLRLRAEMPRLSIAIHEASLATLLDQLATARIDVMVGRFGYRPQGEHYQEQFLADEHLRIVVRPGHALAGRRKVSWSDVLAYEWVLPAAGTPVRDRLEILFAELRMRMPARLCESSSVVASIALISQSDMVMPLSDGLAQHYRRLGQARILPIDLPPIFGPLAVVWRASDPQSPAVSRLVALLAQSAQELNTHPPARRRRPRAQPQG